MRYAAIRNSAERIEQYKRKLDLGPPTWRDATRLYNFIAMHERKIERLVAQGLKQEARLSQTTWNKYQREYARRNYVPGSRRRAKVKKE